MPEQKYPIGIQSFGDLRLDGYVCAGKTGFKGVAMEELKKECVSLSSGSRRLCKAGLGFSRGRRCIDGWKIE